MKSTGRRTYKAATPASLLPETLTMKPIVQVPSRDNHKSKKKKKKCITGLLDDIPSELLPEILSHLGPISNIKASLVCKAWCEAAVSVRKFPTLPWVFYLSEDGYYTLLDPSKTQEYTKKLPELEDHDHEPVYSRDGWLLMAQDNPWKLEFFLNPFTLECIYLPPRSRFFSGTCLAFSAAPTSTSCLVVSFAQSAPKDIFVVATWRPGETVWTIHRYRNKSSSSGIWDKCVFSNGVFYGFSICGYVAVFHPRRATLDVFTLKRLDCPAYFHHRKRKEKSMLMMEHNGNIFVVFKRHDKLVFKLNLESMVWEEKSEACGLTLFTSYPYSFTRFTWDATTELLIQYYSVVDEKISSPLTGTSLAKHVAWVDPPHNNFIL